MKFVAPIPPEPINVCQPSPCGPNAQCQILENSPSCTCLPDFIGSPPNCRPECISNSECPSYQACVNQKCKDPCIGACGINSLCQTVNHKPVCSCPIGFTGNARIQCTIPMVEGDLFDFKIFNKNALINLINILNLNTYRTSSRMYSQFRMPE